MESEECPTTEICFKKGTCLVLPLLDEKEPERSRDVLLYKRKSSNIFERVLRRFRPPPNLKSSSECSLSWLSNGGSPRFAKALFFN